MYGILLAVGLLSAMLLFKLICHVKKVDDKSYSFYSFLGIISIAAGLLGAALFQSFYNMIDTAIKTGKWAFKLGGLTFMGGLITGVLVFCLGTLIFAKGKVKRDFFECASYATPCIVLGHMFGRLGCFCAGCCYGKQTDSPLGILFPGDHYKVYPTQLFEVLFLAVLLGVLLLLLFKFDFHKPLLPIYGMSYAVFRFLIEYVRDDDRGAFIPGLTPSQFQVIILFLVAAALAVLVFVFKIIPFAKAKDVEMKHVEVAPKADANNETSNNPDNNLNNDK